MCCLWPLDSCMLVASALIGMCPKPQRRLLLLLPFLLGTFFRFSLLLLNSLFFSLLSYKNMASKQICGNQKEIAAAVSRNAPLECF